MGKIADISKWQGDVNWEKAKDELDLAILRASCGQDIFDSKYLRNVDGCTRYSVPFGAYHYVKAGTADEARKEALFFVESVKKAAKLPSFYIADIEYKAQTKQTTETVCVTFLETLRESGLKKIGLYINTRYKYAGKAIEMCDIMWIPHWGTNDGNVPADKYKSSHPHDIWQYTSKGKLAGISGRVDLNVLTGSKPLSYFTESNAETENEPVQEQAATDTETKESDTMFTNLDLVQFVKKVYDEKWRYWYGTCGYKCTTALYKRKKAQYPAHYTAARESGYTAEIKANAMCADCVGMIKAFFWLGGDTAGTNKYGANNCPDKSANGMYQLCKENGKIATIPEIPGLVVWKTGHIGVYIGNGYTIEMRGFAYDCVKRKVSDGPWTNWGKLPDTMLSYGDETTVETDDYELGERALKKGCDGNDVKALQEALLAIGYALPKYGADGDFGAETQTAVKAFQEANGLDTTGIFDEAAYKLLIDIQTGNTVPSENDDTPDEGSKPAYVLVIEGDEQQLRLAQSAYGGKLVAADSVTITEV